MPDVGLKYCLLSAEQIIVASQLRYGYNTFDVIKNVVDSGLPIEQLYDYSDPDEHDKLLHYLTITRTLSQTGFNADYFDQGEFGEPLYLVGTYAFTNDVISGPRSFDPFTSDFLPVTL